MRRYWILLRLWLGVKLVTFGFWVMPIEIIVDVDVEEE